MRFDRITAEPISAIAHEHRLASSATRQSSGEPSSSNSRAYPEASSPNGLERTQDLALLIEHRHHMTLGSNVDSRKPHHPTSFLHSVPRASEPELALLLVHARTLFAPLDTVRALSPGRGRQSSAQGFTFSTAGGDTSPGSLPHVSRSHTLLARPDRRRWPGKRVLACLRRSSRLRASDSKPRPMPPTFFPRPPDRVRGRGKKCSVPLSL
jgi:hypothetical protein